MNSQGATEFEPSIEWVNEDDCDTLLLYLPGFMKEQLRVQLRSRTLIISGQRRLHDNALSLFRKEVVVAEHCDISKISAKFEGSILYVKQPKSTPPTTKQEEKHQTNAPTPVPENPIDKPKAQQEIAKYDSKPTSLRQPNKNDDVQNNMKENPEKDLGENHVDEPKLQKEKIKYDSKSTSLTQQHKEKDGNTKEEVGELKDPKGVFENTLKTTGSGSSLAMKLKPSRNVVTKVLVFATGLVVGVYWAKLIQSWMS